MQGRLAPREHGGLTPALDVSVTVAHYRVELGVVPDTRVLREHGLGGAVAPASVLRSPAPEVLLSSLGAVVAALLAVVGGVGGRGAEVRVPPLA